MSLQSKHNYIVPFPREVKPLAVFDPRAHFGRYQHAIDFIVPLGTPVIAGMDGIIHEIKEDSKKGGDDIKYGHPKFLNYIVLRHKDNEYSLYGHLAWKSATLRLGNVVKTGQIIAYTGISGLMTAPHLHFHVFQYDHSRKIQTIKVKFTNHFFVHILKNESEKYADLFSFIVKQRTIEEG